MKLYFDEGSQRKVTEANINCYALPFVHPERTMAEHDFIYLLEGEWKFGQNDEVFCMEKDTLLILSANNRHFGISPCKKDTKTMYFHLTFEEGDGFSETDGINNFINAANNKNIKRIFRDIVEAKISGKDKKADLLANLLLCELNEEVSKDDQNPLVEKIKNLIHRHPEKFFSNKDLAENLGVSVKTAENKFKQMCGVTIHQYVLNFKVEQAISFFKNYPDMQIKEIAFNLGFYDEYHFSKQFKKITGISPMIYKKELYSSKDTFSIS